MVPWLPETKDISVESKNLEPTFEGGDGAHVVIKAEEYFREESTSAILFQIQQQESITWKFCMTNLSAGYRVLNVAGVVRRITRAQGDVRAICSEYNR